MKLKLFFIGLTALLVNGCYPGYDVTIEDLDLAITHYNSDQDFTALNTFYMYDTVVHIVGEDETVDRTHDSHILSELRRNLVTNGWTEITDTTNNRDNIDVVVFASVLSTDVYSYYYYWYDYWYWYPWDWYYPYYDSYYYYYYYPGYYPGYASYSYSLGTIFCEMINITDFEAQPPEGDKVDVKVPIIWTGAINGIISGSDASINSRITKQMTQVFEQSPYLNK